MQSGRAFLAHLVLTPFANPAFDLSAVYHKSANVFVTRRPIPLRSYGNQFTPLDGKVWLLIGVCLLLISLCVHLTHHVHSKNPDTRELIRPEPNWFNFYLFTFAKITEPEALPWFVKSSSGTVLVVSWVLLSTFTVVFFYTCNLRAHMLASTFESKIETRKDVIDNGKRVWMSKKGGLLRYMRGSNIQYETGTIDPPRSIISGTKLSGRMEPLLILSHGKSLTFRSHHSRHL